MSAETPDPVIIFMPEGSKTHLGGTMRLGARATVFQPGSEWSKVRRLYSEAGQIQERHRHRYEVNPDYVDRLSEAGLNFVGKDEKGERMEIVELKDHPYFVGVQFHPEYLSRVLNPSKPYLGFMAASSGYVHLLGGSACLANLIFYCVVCWINFYQSRESLLSFLCHSWKS